MPGGSTGARPAGRLFTGLLAVLFGLVMLVVCGAAALAWRLSAAPVDVTALVQRLAPSRWQAGRVVVQIVPEGGGHALHVAVSDGELRAVEGEPAQSLRSATASLALRPLLAGEVAPTDVTLDGLRLQLATPRQGAAKDTEPSFDLQRLLSRLQHVAVTDARAEIAEGSLGQGVSVVVPAANAVRDPDGTLRARLEAMATTGGATVNLQAHGSYAASGGEIQISSPSVNPAVMARAVPVAGCSRWVRRGRGVDAGGCVRAGAGRAACQRARADWARNCEASGQRGRDRHRPLRFVVVGGGGLAHADDAARADAGPCAAIGKSRYHGGDIRYGGPCRWAVCRAYGRRHRPGRIRRP